MGSSSRAGELARILCERSPEFAELWDAHEVGRLFPEHKTLIHPEIGPIDLSCQALFTEDARQVLLVLSAPPHTEAARQLELLAVIGSQTMQG